MQGAFFFVLVAIVSTLFTVDASWEKEEEEDGITVYTREKSGKDYLEYRSDFIVESSLKRVKEVLVDIESYKDWMPSTLESKLLNKVNDSLFYAYSVADTPWPASNRDLVFKGIVANSGKSSCTITYTSSPNAIEHHPDYVRIEEYTAVWKLEEIAPNKVSLSYVFSFDPGSSYPSWMIKGSIISARIEVAQGLRQRV